MKVPESYRAIGLDEREEWTKTLATVPHAFAHTWDCCHAIHQTTGYATYLICFDVGSTLVACPIAERDWQGAIDIVTPYGFAGFVANGTVSNFTARWRAFCEQKKYICSYIALHPLLDDVYLHGPTQTSNTLYILDLRLGVDELFSRMSQSRRRIIRRWRESGRKFTFERKRIAEFLVANYGPFMRSVGASNATYMSDSTLRLLSASPQVEFTGVEESGRIVAIHAFAYTCWAAESLFFLALPEGRDFMTPLYWDAVERCAALHIPSLNLGGGVTPDDAIAFAKKRYGAEPHPFMCVKEVHRTGDYIRLCNAAGADAADLDGYFPAYRRQA